MPEIEYNELMKLQERLLRVRTLRVLKFIAYPECWSLQETNVETPSMEVRFGALQHALRTAADKIFQTLGPACPRLLVVIFDVVGDFYYEPFHSLAVFIRSKQIDPVGRTTYGGAPIDAHQVKRYEPCCDLLDKEEFHYD